MLGLNSWFLNFAQYSWKDLTPKTLADIPSPYLEYNIYWTFKSIQITSFFGGCIVHPIYRYYLYQKLTPETRTNNSNKVIRNICRRIQGRYLIGGFFLAPLLTIIEIKWKNYSKNDVRQKCYEIRCDNKELTYDRSTAVLGLIGWYWKRFQGAVDGINFALLYFVIYQNFLRKFTNPMITDKLKIEDRFVNVQEAEKNKNAITSFINKNTKND